VTLSVDRVSNASARGPAALELEESFEPAELRPSTRCGQAIRLRERRHHVSRRRRRTAAQRERSEDGEEDHREAA
jgi:hypothetical protein